MGIESINPATPFLTGAKEKAKSAGTFVYGRWADDFGRTMAKDFCNELGMQQNGSKFTDILKGDTWKTAGRNVSKIKNFTDTSLYQKPIDTISTTYKSAVAETGPEAMAAKKAAKLAEKAAKEAAGKTGWFGNIIKSIKTAGESAIKSVGKVLDPVVKPVTNLLSHIPGVNSACKAIGNFGKNCKLPVIGTLLMTIGEIPSVINAFAKGGLGEGVKQLVRSTGELAVSCGAFAIGSAAGAGIAGVIGQVLCPIPGLGFALGAAIGIGASILAEKVAKPVFDGILGKSFEEKEEIAAQKQEQQTNKTQVVQSKNKPPTSGANVDTRNIDIASYGLSQSELDYIYNC